MTRRLALRAERLTDLTTDDLAGIAGAAQEIPTRKCFTGYYPSINAPCTTIAETITTAVSTTG